MAEDLFSNILPIKAAFDGSNSTTLTEETFETGMTPFSDRPWGMSIAKVQWIFADYRSMDAVNKANLVLSTRQGQDASGIQYDQAGVISRYEPSVTCATAAGGGPIIQPWSDVFIPTILIATPKLSVYCSTLVDDATLQGQSVYVRILFLTVSMSQQRWNEVNQTWSLSA